MNAHVVEVAWLDARETLSRPELARVCGLTEPELAELMEYGALRPAASGTAAEPLFSAECVPALRRAGRLRRDFDLDLFAVALLVDYLNRIELLEHQLKSLQAQFPKHVPQLHREGPRPWREPHG
jgi:chaperone modulatory protein CbpM